MVLRWSSASSRVLHVRRQWPLRSSGRWASRSSRSSSFAVHKGRGRGCHRVWWPTLLLLLLRRHAARRLWPRVRAAASYRRRVAVRRRGRLRTPAVRRALRSSGLGRHWRAHMRRRWPLLLLLRAHGRRVLERPLALVGHGQPLRQRLVAGNVAVGHDLRPQLIRLIGVHLELRVGNATGEAVVPGRWWTLVGRATAGVVTTSVHSRWRWRALLGRHSVRRRPIGTRSVAHRRRWSAGVSAARVLRRWR